MGNYIKFEAFGGKIVQVDDAFKSRVVVFECNEDFWIRFDAGGNPFYDLNDPEGDHPINQSPVTFDAKEYKKGLYKIKIKFSDGDHADGYKYTAGLRRGGELDPRICPK